MKKILVIHILMLTALSLLSATIQVQGELFVKNIALPGESYTGTLQIANPGERNERVQLTQVDYLYFADGNNVFHSPGTDPRSNAPWIQLAKDVVVVPPGMSVTVPYTVIVPSDPSLSGVYWSIVFVEAITDSLLNPDLKEDEVAALSVNYRFGVQIVTQIGQTGKPGLQFKDIQVATHSEEKTLTFSIENTGETQAAGSIYALLYSKTGSFLGRYDGRGIASFPGTSVARSISFPDLEPGSYRIQLLADIGKDKIFGVLVSPTFE